MSLEPAAPWSGREDPADGARARRWHQVVEPGRRDAPLSLLGLASDAGVSRNGGRPGAAAGPREIRRALANLAVHRVNAAGDLGDVLCEGGALEEAQQAYAAAGVAAIGEGRLLLGLGGGHEIAWASYCALRDALDAAGDAGAIGIVNFDAHFDLRGDAEASSGTPFRQILEDAAGRGRRVDYRCLGISRQSNTAALFERAQALGVQFTEDVDLRDDQGEALAADLASFCDRHQHLYLSVCLDVFPAAVAPGVSAPAAMGVEPQLVERLIGVVAASPRLRVADIAELNPQYDQDGRTARLAARLAARIAEAQAGS